MKNPEWVIENLAFDQIDGRYLPGNTITLNFMLRNLSERDFYFTKVGIQPEWLVKQSNWYSQEVNDILKPRQMIKVALIFTIPNDLPLGEYEMIFGVEAQYLPVQSYRDQILSTTWSMIVLYS